VDAEEIGRLIADLENRVERLRSLYEQYFMGIERIEPLTLRKDIDRRLWALRREQIRNTGLRFKLETTIQRYNTYQQYWQRIVREIEQGTYQRDIGRAAQRFGDNVVTGFARRRQKMYEKGLEKKTERDAQRRTEAGAASQAPPAEGGEQAPSSSSETYDVTFEDSAASELAAARSLPATSPEPHEPLELDIGEPAPPMPSPPRRDAPAVPGAVPPTQERRQATPAPPMEAARAPTAVAQPPAPAGTPPAHARPPFPAAPTPRPIGAAPLPPRAPLASSSGQDVAQSPAKPVAPAAMPLKPAAPIATAPIATSAKPATPFAVPAKPPAPVPTTATFAKPATTAAAPFKPAGSSPMAPSAGAPAQPASPSPKPFTPTLDRPAALRPPVAQPPARPLEPLTPKAAPSPVRPASPTRPEAHAPAVLSEDNTLSPIRMRQIYGAFVEAKRKANESTATVTYEKIASNLETVAKELRAKHKARSVDFEVVMKNGKPVLKPVVKG
jgi:hypothetical protein